MSGQSPDRHDVLQRVRPVIDRVLRRLIGARDPEYEDLLQSSLVHVLATVEGGRYRGDCPLPDWAAAITRNVAMNALRARSRERRVFDRTGESESLAAVRALGAAPEHLAHVRRQLEELAGALSSLNPAKADVVYLHDVLGYDLTEVAQFVGASVAAAQSRLVRGRRELADHLERERDPFTGGRRRRRSHTRSPASLPKDEQPAEDRPERPSPAARGRR